MATHLPTELARPLEVERRQFGGPLDRAIMRTPDGEDATGDGNYSFEGRAVLYGAPVTLLESNALGVRLTEEIAPGALTEALKTSDTMLTWGHDLERSIARLQAVGDKGEIDVGGMRLTEDEDGLKVFARLDAEDPDVRSLAAKMKRGMIDQMSFWAVVGEEESERFEDEDGLERTHYTIRSLKDLIDVTVTARGVYRETEAALRSAELSILEDRRGRSLEGLVEARRSGEGVRILQLRAKAALSRLQ